VFLTAVTLYVVNRWVIRPRTDALFFHGYVNGLLLVPMFVPLLVSMTELAGLRPTDGPPTTVEIIVPLVIWSVAFEVVLPRSAFWGKYLYADPWDVVCYCAGAAIAATVWRLRYGRHTIPADR